MASGTYWAPRRRSVVLKTFQNLSQTPKLGGPGSSCQIQAPEGQLKEKATWLSLRSARLPCEPNKE
eukprot:6874005-Alexandrium_andersonii.AAC.1